MKICVLLSTYNGEKYLHEQLCSLSNQTYSDFSVCIRDDGSSDKTVDIVKQYCLSDKRFNLLPPEGNVGCAQSFLCHC
jgi:Glycosyltransferases involved in cell wall biogenesis